MKPKINGDRLDQSAPRSPLHNLLDQDIKTTIERSRSTRSTGQGAPGMTDSQKNVDESDSNTSNI
jgi:hypothetical protein